MYVSIQDSVFDLIFAYFLNKNKIIMLWRYYRFVLYEDFKLNIEKFIWNFEIQSKSLYWEGIIDSFYKNTLYQILLDNFVWNLQHFSIESMFVNTFRFCNQNLIQYLRISK